MFKRTTAFLVLASFLCPPFLAHAETLPASSGHGLDSMAPAGRWAVRLEVRTNGYDQWYDDNGARHAFNAAFDSVALDGTVCPALALLGPTATLGTTTLASRAELDATQLILGYGLSDDLTAGLILPYVTTRSRIDFSVSGGNTGFNPAFDPAQPISAGNFPFAPVGGGASAPLDTAGMQQVLSNPAFGYGYAPVQSTTTQGWADPTLGLLWRYHKDERSSALFAMGMRFGVAKGDDPDNLTDIPIGDGSNDIRLRLEYFRDLGGDFDLRLLAEHFIQLADHADMRVLQPGQLLAPASSKERLKRDLGDYQEYDIELGHHWDAWRASATWHLYTKAADRYRSDLGTDTRALEANTQVRADQWRASLSWSGIDAWREGRLFMPLIVKFEMQETYGGRNFPKVRDYYLQVTSFF